MRKHALVCKACKMSCNWACILQTVCNLACSMYMLCSIHAALIFSMSVIVNYCYIVCIVLYVVARQAQVGS